MFTILCIEDEADHRLILHTILTGRGFTTAMANNGDEGLILAKGIRPDLILLDLYMPKTNGFSVIKGLKEDPATRSIPIIVVSAWLAGDHCRLALEAGAIDVISKPYDPEVLADLIEERLTVPLEAGLPVLDMHALEI